MWSTDWFNPIYTGGVNLTRGTFKFEKLLICWSNWAEILWLFLTFFKVYENEKVFFASNVHLCWGSKIFVSERQFMSPNFSYFDWDNLKKNYKVSKHYLESSKRLFASYKHSFRIFSEFLSQFSVLAFPAPNRLMTS